LVRDAERQEHQRAAAERRRLRERWNAYVGWCVLGLFVTGIAAVVAWAHFAPDPDNPNRPSAETALRSSLTAGQLGAMRSLECSARSTYGFECVVRFRGHSDDDNATFYVNLHTKQLYRHP
jgi:hypothetical protein